MSELSTLMEKALIDSVKDCFSTTLNVDLTEGGEVRQPNPDRCLICSVGFAGKIEGNLAIAIVDTSACKIVGLMLGMEFTEIDSDVKDGFGEVGNMIIGGVKTRISQAGYTCDISVPTTIFGKNMELSFPKDVIQIAKHFQAPDISFDAFIDFKIHKETAPTANQAPTASEAAIARLKALVSDKTKAMETK